MHRAALISSLLGAMLSAACTVVGDDEGDRARARKPARFFKHYRGISRAQNHRRRNDPGRTQRHGSLPPNTICVSRSPPPAPQQGNVECLNRCKYKRAWGTRAANSAHKCPHHAARIGRRPLSMQIRTPSPAPRAAWRRSSPPDGAKHRQPPRPRDSINSYSRCVQRLKSTSYVR